MIREQGVTMVTGVPTQWQRVLEHPDLDITDFSGVRVAGLGGASIAPELVARMRARLGCPVLARYTSTEAGVCTSTRIGDPDEVVANTVGRPAPEVELRLLGPEGVEVEEGAVGEIVCRSPAMMRGYWRDPDRTAETVDEDGFLHTGDLGRFDDDGNLRIVGRLKEMYIRGGYNVYPAEVEGVLADHPDVDRSAVVGVPERRPRRDRGGLRGPGTRGRARAGLTASLVPRAPRRLQGTGPARRRRRPPGDGHDEDRQACARRAGAPETQEEP